MDYLLTKKLEENSSNMDKDESFQDEHQDDHKVSSEESFSIDKLLLSLDDNGEYDDSLGTEQGSSLV